MLAAVVEQPGQLAVREVPMPIIDETECLVEILACGLCNSTDRKLLDGHFRYKGPEAYPGILGHEAVGRVIECGAAVESFEVGDLVLRPGASYPVGRGPTSMYGGLAQYGKIKDPVHGGSALHQLVPPDLLSMPVGQAASPARSPVGSLRAGEPPALLTAADLTLLVTLKETLSWLQRWLPDTRRAGVSPAPESVVVLGSGPVGLSFAWFARLLGCHPVLVLGRRDEPLERALDMGVDAVINTERDDPRAVVDAWTQGRGADCVIEAVGDEAMLQLGLSLLSPQGRLGVYGIASTRTPGDMERRAVDIGLARNEWAIEFLNPQEHAPHEQMLWLVRRGIVRLTDWYTHVVPLAETQRGFDLLERKEAFKVVVRI